MDEQNVGIDVSVTAVFQEYIKTLQGQTQKLESENKQLHDQANSLQQQVNGLKDSITTLSVKIESMNTQIAAADNLWNTVQTPYGAGVSVALIFAIAYIAVKRGFTFSKGNTKLSVGEKEK